MMEVFLVSDFFTLIISVIFRRFFHPSSLLGVIIPFTVTEVISNSSVWKVLDLFANSSVSSLIATAYTSDFVCKTAPSATYRNSPLRVCIS